MTADYHKQYYIQNKDTILPRIRAHNKHRYDNDLEFKLLKRYQSRVDNYYRGQRKLKAEDLLMCSPEFFVKWIQWCLRDMVRAKHSYDDIEIHHVRPVSTFPDNDLSGWSWINTLPVTQSENLEQGKDRDMGKEKTQIRRVTRFLKSCNIDVIHEGGEFDIQSILSKLPFSTTHIPGELHFPGANYCGPGTSLDGSDGRPARLNPDDSPKDWSKPINAVDAECYTHDLDYRASGNNLARKHEADRKLLAALEKIQPQTFRESVMKKVVEICMKLKLKLGFALPSSSVLSPSEILGLGLKKVTVPPEYAKRIAEELHAPGRKHYPRRRIYYNYLDHTWAIDLMEMPKDKTYKYCLVVIDMWSKYLWLAALENKTGSLVTEAMQEIINQSKRNPLKINSDRGKEFLNNNFQKFLKDNSIELYHVESENKSSIVERVIRTIRQRIEPILTEKELTGQKASWVDTLPQVLRWYNNEHIHRTTKLTPVAASLPENQDQLKTRYKEIRSVRLPESKPLELNQFVRIYKWKNKFEKGSAKNWSSEIFQIAEVLDTNPRSYRLRDENNEIIQGAFYVQELLPTAFTF